MDRYAELICEASRPLTPLPTQMVARRTPLTDIAVVIFDIYGTLLVSGSGDVGTAAEQTRGHSFSEALAAVGLTSQRSGEEDAAEWLELIREEHRTLRADGNPFPEIGIREIWERFVDRGKAEGRLEVPPAVDFSQLAIEYETRVNPVWPMPGLQRCLEGLRATGRKLGIISNAQFFTPIYFPALLNRSLSQLGFEEGLRFYSYVYRMAKPGHSLYERAADKLAEQGVLPSQTLYVGNDMRNDIWPAADVGFKTVLFAGDQRSLRLRKDQPDATRRPQPDALITHLGQILDLVPST